MGKPLKNNYFLITSDKRLPLSKTINFMTNIITAVMLNYFSMKTQRGEEKKKGRFIVDFAGPQLLLMMISSLQNGRSHE